MNELREIIAKNICDLRTERKITQFRLAEVLNYSDKAVSKWERGESVPDVAVLKQIADYFGVSVDYLLTEDHTVYERERRVRAVENRRNRTIITLLAVTLVWFVAALLFVELRVFLPDAALPTWMMFIYAVPLSAVILLIFNSLWGKPRANYLLITCLVWTLLLSVYLSLLTLSGNNIWLLFILGVPAQLIILLWSGLKIKK